ncbi:DUF488 family protein [Oceaniferula flava]|uniref:DUF488 family protein n=1 Tax=Oceaniferula flava TaxID=2800421 RepID=UPI002867BF3D|nr:DUF488 family protein [Oceaniferula flavus]
MQKSVVYFKGKITEQTEDVKRNPLRVCSTFRLAEVDRKSLLLLYAAKDKKHNHARVLKGYLERLG